MLKKNHLPYLPVAAEGVCEWGGEGDKPKGLGTELPQQGLGAEPW